MKSIFKISSPYFPYNLQLAALISSTNIELHSGGMD